MQRSIVIAVASNGVIGHKNGLVWRLKADLQHFKKLTTSNTIIMGRKTYESIGKPLPNRNNIVVSRNKNLKLEGCMVATSLEEALEIASSLQKDIFVIGGAEIYTIALPLVDIVYLTRVLATPTGDAYFDLGLLSNFDVIQSEFKGKDSENEFDVYFEKLVKNKKTNT
jgi:dihydrofolate reductase